MDKVGGRRRSALSVAVVKAMGIFGGVQAINIILSILRSKLIAIWLGPMAFGLFALYNQAIMAISTLSGLSINQSCVRDIASSRNSGQTQRIITSVRRWAWLLGITGSVLMFLSAPLLSDWAFGERSHSYAFRILSVCVLLYSLQTCELAILQGLGLLKRMASASLWGSALGMTAAIPLFYLLRMSSIVPVILIFSIAATLASAALRHRNSPSSQHCPTTIKETLSTGRRFIVLGAYITVSLFTTMALNYAFSAYLSSRYSTDTLGYFQAGYNVVNTYVGMIFTAISVEYFPRLSAQIHNTKRASTLVSHEMSIALWILIPVICLFTAMSKPILQVLYSSGFEVIDGYVTLAAAGMLFRAVSWCMSYTILARGDGKIYIFTELTSGAIGLCLNIIMFETWGYSGLGAAYILWYMAYTIITGYVYRFRYRMSIGKGITGLCLFGIAATAVSIAGKWLGGWWIPAITGCAILPYAYRHILSRKNSIPTLSTQPFN